MSKSVRDCLDYISGGRNPLPLWAASFPRFGSSTVYGQRGRQTKQESLSSFLSALACGNDSQLQEPIALTSPQ